MHELAGVAVRDRARFGDSIDLEGAFGEFSLKEAARPILMMAGGTGRATMLRMLDVLRDTGGPKHGVRLLEAVTEWLLKHGLADERIHTEKIPRSG